MRGVQEKRKQTGLAPQDRIELQVETTAAGQQTLESYKEMIMKTVGAKMITYTNNSGSVIKAETLILLYR